MVGVFYRLSDEVSQSLVDSLKKLGTEHSGGRQLPSRVKYRPEEVWPLVRNW